MSKYPPANSESDETASNTNRPVYRDPKEWRHPTSVWAVLKSAAVVLSLLVTLAWLNRAYLLERLKPNEPNVKQGVVEDTGEAAKGRIPIESAIGLRQTEALHSEVSSPAGKIENSEAGESVNNTIAAKKRPEVASAVSSEPPSVPPPVVPPQPPVLESVKREMSPQERLERSLFAVVVRSATSEPGLRVGTAWAVSERQLGTSGSLVLFLQQSKSEFPIVTVQRVFDGEEHPVTTSIVHSECQRKTERMQKLGAQIENARRQLESATAMTGSDDDPPDAKTVDPESAETLAEKIITLEDQWFVTAEDMIHFDAGLLETAASVTADQDGIALPFAVAKPSRLASVTIAGAAFGHDQSVLVESSRLPLLNLECTLESLVAYSGDAIPRLVLKCSPEHIQQNWLGAPVLDSSGQVIGFYSRPTPSLNPETPPDGNHCDIVSIERVASLLSSE